MRIAFVISTHRWGGTKTWSLDMGRAATAAGHQVFVYGRDPRFMEKARQEGMHGAIAPFGMDFNPRSILFFRNEWKKHKISHVVVNVGKDLRTAGIAARWFGIPVIVHVGAPRDFTDSATRRFVHRLVRPSYVCCSEFTARHIQAEIPYMAHARVAVVHPGTAMPQEAPCPSRMPYTLITTSQLTPPKRHADLILGCALLKEQGVPFALRIVGVGDQEENLRLLVQEHKLEAQISFVGFSAEISKELRKADIFVLPTDAEPLGIALEEAMAHGLFPLARHSGGVPEIWPERFHSYLLPANAGPADFAQALRELLATPPTLLDEWRTQVQAHARAAFSLDSQWLRFAEFLQRL